MRTPLVVQIKQITPIGSSSFYSDCLNPYHVDRFKYHWKRWLETTIKEAEKYRLVLEGIVIRRIDVAMPENLAMVSPKYFRKIQSGTVNQTLKSALSTLI